MKEKIGTILFLCGFIAVMAVVETIGTELQILLAISGCAAMCVGAMIISKVYEDGEDG